jgi:hypothetical protein
VKSVIASSKPESTVTIDRSWRYRSTSPRQGPDDPRGALEHDD